MKWIYRTLGAWLVLAAFIMAAPFDDPEPLSVDATTRNQDNDRVNFNNTSNTYSGSASGLTNLGNTLVTFKWGINGTLTTGTAKDGFRTASRSGTILDVYMTVGGRGKTGTAIFDINIHTNANVSTTQYNNVSGSTIYTNQSNRPQIVGLTSSKSDNATFRAATPDVTNFTAGTTFSVDCDQAGSQVKDTSINILLRLNDE